MMNADYVKMPELFDYNQPRIEEYHTPKVSPQDKTLIALFEALNAGDWAQTSQISRNPDQYRELPFPQGSSNFIGRNPSQRNVNILMGLNALLYPLIRQSLSQPYKGIFDSVAIGGKAKAVSGNRDIGLDIFRW